ncbi:hypothetical protein V2W45_1471179 [Cenococcum geophilum]
MLFLGIIKNHTYNGIFRSSNTLKSLLVNYLYVNGITIFIVNFIAIIPLTVMLSYTTKEITLRASNTLGSLLNATFRNAVKLIISILALTKGQITIIKTSLIGSMLSNLLLILNICFFFGVADTTAGLLALYVSGLIILTTFHSTLLTISPNSSILNWELSYGIAIIFLIIYISARAAAISREEEDNKIKEPKLTIWGVIITLGFSTALVAFYSKFIVNSISNITASGTVSTTFIGLILLLIIRNATKYIIAVTVAYKDKISLVINVAIRFSIQIALLDYIILYFNTFLITILFVTVLLVNYLIQNSKSNWLKGVLIIVIYTIIAVTS